MSRPDYGGQAVIEGVMMRGQENVAVAVRKEDEEIVVDKREFVSLTDRIKVLGWPLIRGVVALFQSLILGMRALTFSANQFSEEEEELTWWELITTIGVAFVLAILLFIALPAGIIRLIQPYIGANVVLNLIEGVLKVTFLLTYIVAISQMEDIERVFEYHGAEHKVIHTYESELDLTVDNAQQFSTLHPRCGTNFLLLVMIVSILLFSFFGRPNLINRVLIHLALLPAVAGISYELIKWAGQEDAPWIANVIAIPGLYLQKFTTREPSADQLEVAMESLEAILEAEEPEES